MLEHLNSVRLQANGIRVDHNHWLQFIHGSLDYDRHLQPNPELRKVLQSIQLPRFVFTNSDTAHAKRCLERIGILDCFEVCHQHVTHVLVLADLSTVEKNHSRKNAGPIRQISYRSPTPYGRQEVKLLPPA